MLARTLREHVRFVIFSIFSIVHKRSCKLREGGLLSRELGDSRDFDNLLNFVAEGMGILYFAKEKKSIWEPIFMLLNANEQSYESYAIIEAQQSEQVTSAILAKVDFPKTCCTTQSSTDVRVSQYTTRAIAKSAHGGSSVPTCTTTVCSEYRIHEIEIEKSSRERAHVSIEAVVEAIQARQAT